ncbi:hypothetical protein [Janthinobacterium sp.]|uniref:hypothetical protein n=1 Tax=Janthinobacterium sp. TaxID=1871054 RepID=UPI00293D5D7C|nr:hypothetical protein [Janthinobacterium sp.]
MVATAEEQVLRAVCVWRLSDREKLSAPGLPSDPARLAVGARHHRNTNKLREAADNYLDEADPPS